MEQLKKLRKLSNKTLKDVAIDFNTSPQVISRYELGQAEPDFSTLIKLADYFNVSIDYLLGHEVKAQETANRPEYNISDKFANDYADLLKDTYFMDTVKLYNAISSNYRALCLGYIVNLLQNKGIDTKIIIGY